MQPCKRNVQNAPEIYKTLQSTKEVRPCTYKNTETQTKSVPIVEVWHSKTAC